MGGSMMGMPMPMEYPVPSMHQTSYYDHPPYHYAAEVMPYMGSYGAGMGKNWEEAYNEEDGYRAGSGSFGMEESPRVILRSSVGKQQKKQPVAQKEKPGGIGTNAHKKKSKGTPLF
jgi:hypothetical protein